MVLASEYDNPTLGADPNRNNDFSYADDMDGLKCPFGAHIRLLFHELEGYPGIHSPNIKDWIVKQQVTSTAFYSAYLNASVKDVWKALKIKDTLNDLLDQETS